ncbi:MAG: hypothetical protein ABI759_29495 [Candidatus Solibacter sp.]
MQLNGHAMQFRSEFSEVGSLSAAAREKQHLRARGQPRDGSNFVSGYELSGEVSN